MNKCPITLNLSPSTITLRAADLSVEQFAMFEVQVRNDSTQQAQFQVIVTAAGASPTADWYRLDPEVSVAKPPGDVTTFQVHIIRSPIPNFSGLINLTVRVISPQLPGEGRGMVRLLTELSSGIIPISLNLVPAYIQAYPRNSIDLMVQLRNLSYQPIDTLLRLSGLNSGWLPNGSERRILLNPQADERVIFQCQPPAVDQAASKTYAFQVEAFSRSIPLGQARGVLEILPIGFIKFAVTPEQQSIPVKGGVLKGWLPNWREDAATFSAKLENLSNLAQHGTIEIKQLGSRLGNGKLEQSQLTYTPPVALLGLGETAKLPLVITIKRPWVGWVKTLPLELTPVLLGDRAVDVEPTRQTVKLRLYPLIPLWLLLALLTALLLLLALIFRPVPISHTDFVNAVRFSDDLSLVSGADDCTIRRWKVEGDRLSPAGGLSTLPASQQLCRPFPAQGVLAFTGKPVRALAFSPRVNDRVAAGLENGAIQFWHLLTQQPLEELPGAGDRIFDLVFTEAATQLFSGHGSGNIQIWQRQGNRFLPKPLQTLSWTPEQKHSIYALDISPDGRWLVSAGSKNTLAVWDLAHLDRPPQLLMQQRGEDEKIWDVTFKPGTQTIAIGDSQGYIALWDLDRCLGAAAPTATPTTTLPDCQIDRWQVSAVAVRSVRFSPDGKHLISGGDDKQVKLWTLNAPGESLSPAVLLTSAEKISAIDVIETGQDLLIVSGGDDQQVHLERIRKGGQ